jgi:hypothetical protein
VYFGETARFGAGEEDEGLVNRRAAAGDVERPTSTYSTRLVCRAARPECPSVQMFGNGTRRRGRAQCRGDRVRPVRPRRLLVDDRFQQTTWAASSGSRRLLTHCV